MTNNEDPETFNGYLFDSISKYLMFDKRGHGK